MPDRKTRRTKAISKGDAHGEAPSTLKINSAIPDRNDRKTLELLNDLWGGYRPPLKGGVA